MQQIIFKNDFYTFSRFAHFPIIAAFSNRKLDLGFKNSLNRKEFLRRLGVDYRNLVCLKQVHGDGVIVVNRKDKGKGAIEYKTAILKKDALITGEKNLPIAVFTADCLPIFLYDTKREIISLIHAGRKGTEKEITKKTILKMKKEFKTEPKDLYVGFGPAIRSCCYEMDLIKENFDQLTKFGVKRKNIFDSEFCTSCYNYEFFSFRKEGEFSGRMMSVMMLNGET